MLLTLNDDCNAVYLKSLLSKTIQDHLQTNQKLIINLSGGIDSNIILHEALKNNEIESFKRNNSIKDA